MYVFCFLVLFGILDFHSQLAPTGLSGQSWERVRAWNKAIWVSFCNNVLVFKPFPPFCSSLSPPNQENLGPLRTQATLAQDFFKKSRDRTAPLTGHRSTHRSPNTKLINLRTFENSPTSWPRWRSRCAARSSRRKCFFCIAPNTWCFFVGQRQCFGGHLGQALSACAEVQHEKTTKLCSSQKTILFMDVSAHVCTGKWGSFCELLCKIFRMLRSLQLFIPDYKTTGVETADTGLVATICFRITICLLHELFHFNFLLVPFYE